MSLKPSADISGIKSEENFDLARNTTYGVGGLCKKAYFPTTEDEATQIYATLTEAKEKFFILGNGSNILASDSFYDGSVICTAGLNGIFEYGDKLKCQSGVRVGSLLQYCISNGLSGLEFLAGIPASVGGLTFMNGGAGGKFISDVLEVCTVFTKKTIELSNKSCSFGYKYSTMRDINCMILSCEFNVERSSPTEVKNNIAQYLQRRSKQPKGKSCGCVFKNPDGVSAGYLIEACGLKGFRCGGAEVSRKHANFIINDNGARAADIYKLIEHIKREVFSAFGVRLEEEVVYIGEF